MNLFKGSIDWVDEPRQYKGASGEWQAIDAVIREVQPLESDRQLDYINAVSFSTSNPAIVEKLLQLKAELDKGVKHICEAELHFKVREVASSKTGRTMAVTNVTILKLEVLSPIEEYQRETTAEVDY